MELSKDCEEEGLIHRMHGTPDRRFVILQVTPDGRRSLQSLLEDHAQDLYELAPRLIRALTRIRRSNIQRDKDGASTRAIRSGANAV